MKNNPKLQCFNQNLRNTNFIYCITSKNKIAEVEKNQQPLKENQRPVTWQCFIQSIKLMEHLIAASEFRKQEGGDIMYISLPPSINEILSELLQLVQDHKILECDLNYCNSAHTEYSVPTKNLSDFSESREASLQLIHKCSVICFILRSAKHHISNAQHVIFTC